jgi:ATP-dependent protease ClpP protease subunit
MNWYSIKNSINNNLSISIDEEIGSYGINAKDFIEEVKGAGSKNIELTINSGGGSVFEAFAIYDFLKTSSYNVSVEIVGVAASAASVLALAGDELPTMTENSVIMIHNAWMPVVSGEGMDSDAIRDYIEELEKNASLMDALNLRIAKIYTKATGMDLEKVQEMMAAETWIFAEDAYEMGFVKEVKEGSLVAAYASPKDLAKMGYKKVPKNYVNQLNNVDMSENKEKSFFKHMMAFFKDSEVKAELEEEVVETPEVEAQAEAVEEVVAEEKVEEVVEEATEEAVEEVSEEVTEEPKDAVDMEAIKAELMAEVKAEISAKDSELSELKKELDKAKASRKPLEAKEDVVNPEAKIEEADELGAAILNILKSSFKA